MPEIDASENSEEPTVPEAPSPPDPPTPPSSAIIDERVDRISQVAPGARRITDPEYMRVMAHPARMKVIDYLAALRVRGTIGATATDIASVTELSPSAMSYHLRTMAKVGVIVEAENRGDGRQRVWQLADKHTSISVAENAPPSHYEAQSAMMAAFDEQHRMNFYKYLDAVRENPKYEEQWTSFHNARLRMTPEDVTEFAVKVGELVEKYVSYNPEEDDRENTETVMMTFRLFRDPNV